MGCSVLEEAGSKAEIASLSLATMDHFATHLPCAAGAIGMDELSYSNEVKCADLPRKRGTEMTTARRAATRSSRQCGEADSACCRGRQR